MRGAITTASHSGRTTCSHQAERATPLLQIGRERAKLLPLREAVRSYNRYVEEGVLLGRRPDLVGGGLVRSLGGWSAVASLRRSGEKRRTDERILGSGEFVERMIHEAEETVRQEFSRGESGDAARRLVESACRKAGVSVKELRSGSRRGSLGRVRSDLACEIVAKIGMPLADVARDLGVSTSAVCKALSRRKST